ncbi:MAG: DUF3990 domain-containing protein, partial [Flavobacteriaceae bacterium]|nr:DUF3990 domain-containing protein [Flavobacteriaceae bacterium]
MRVYHGSYTKIDEIDLSKSEPKKDFGKGFYVTKYIEQAEFWAERKGKVNNTDACVTEFEFDEYAYKTKDLKILQFDNYTEEWFDFVVLNRQNEELAHDYDIVEGPVADDKINRKLQLFLDGEITREDFFEKLVHIPSHQICFCTFNSLQYLKTKNHKVIY